MASLMVSAVLILCLVVGVAYLFAGLAQLLQGLLFPNLPGLGYLCVGAAILLIMWALVAWASRSRGKD